MVVDASRRVRNVTLLCLGKQRMWESNAINDTVGSANIDQYIVRLYVREHLRKIRYCNADRTHIEISTGVKGMRIAQLQHAVILTVLNER